MQSNSQKSYFERLPEYTKCVLNPFDMPACGYPDFFNEPTSKMKLTDGVTVTSDAAGYAAVSISPSLAKSLYTYTITAGVAGTSTGTAHPDYVEVTGQTLWARTVCMGVRIDYIGASMNAAGTLTVIKQNYSNTLDNQTLTTLLDDGTTGPAAKGRVVPLMPRQTVLYEVDTGNSAYSPTFPYLDIICVGLPPNTACIRVTIVRHVEVLPKKSSATLRASTTLTPASLAALEAVSRVDSSVQSTPDTWTDSLASWARSASGEVLSAAAQYATTRATEYALAGFGLF